MADERIDVEVNDKVSSNVEKKLRAIGDAAGNAHTYVERLKNDLASMNTAGMLKIEAATNSTTRALAAQMNAQARLTAATAKGAVADAKAAVEKQKLATETARTEAAQSRAASAAANAATAQARAQQAAQRAASGTSDYASRAERLKASLDPLYAAQSRFNAEVNEAKTLLGAGAINMRTYVSAVGTADAKLKAAQAAQNSFNNSVEQGNSAVKLAGHHQANLVAQINDIGVSLASGQNPFIVLIQQGSQLQDLSMRVEGGFKTLAMSTLRMVAPFAAAAAVFGVLAAKFTMFKNEIDDQAGIKEYVKTLGLTKKELKELEDQHVTFGDTLLGVWQTIKEALNLDEAFASIMDAGKSAVDFIWNTFKNFSFGLTGLMGGLFELVRQTFTRFPAIIGDAVYSAVNLTIDGINWLAQKSNEIVGTTFGSIDRVSNQYAGTLGEVWQATADTAVRSFNNAEAGYNAFVNRVTQNTVANAKKRLKAQADLMKEDRGPGKKEREDKTAENRALALSKVNAELDNEISRMRMLKDERAIQQRFDQIEEQLLSKKIKLNAEEAASIRSKIEAIEAYKYVQSQADRIMEEAIGPQRDMQAAIDAATQLYDDGKISVERYSAELVKAGRAFDETTDPLFRLTEELDAQYRLLGKYDVELEKANYLEGIRQEYISRGLSIYDENTGKIKAEVAALIAKNDALRQQQQINSTIAEIVNPILDNAAMIANQTEYYAELQRLRTDDVLNERQYQQAKYALDAKFNEMRLNAASGFFGQLASITSNGTGVLAGISKAAAVAQATIQGYQAVQNALATPAPWPLPQIFAATAAIAAAQNVAGILSTNVGSYATGGQFMVEGKGGVDQNNINMNVSRGERVTIETAAQQRANDGSGGAPIVNAPVKVINQFDEREFIQAMDSDEGERIVLNIIKRNPRAVGGTVNQ